MIGLVDCGECFAGCPEGKCRKSQEHMSHEIDRLHDAIAILTTSVEWRGKRIAELEAIINTPHAGDFWKAARYETEHQRMRWSTTSDAGKTPADWFWLVGYLAGKALHAHIAGNTEKAEHHIITAAAACANWHQAVFGKSDMQPGSDAKLPSCGRALTAADVEARK